VKAKTHQRLYDLWSSSQELRAGQEIYEAIPNDKRPLWAAAILIYSIEGAQLNLEPVNKVLDIAQAPRRWREAHRAFQAVRDLTLKAEKKRPSDTHVALLFVAEIAAKVTYNASGEPAPFDLDSGAWMAKNLRHFVSVCKGASEAAAWDLLVGPLRKKSRPQELGS